MLGLEFNVLAGMGKKKQQGKYPEPFSTIF